ncbi:MAG TPA: hypothetical protein DEA08_19635 [Planctomycetes bacterium]|nr:hypothetical protein [Planctomycetota bacterium]
MIDRIDRTEEADLGSVVADKLERVGLTQAEREQLAAVYFDAVELGLAPATGPVAVFVAGAAVHCDPWPSHLLEVWPISGAPIAR